MKSSTRNRIKGGSKELKGRAKKAVGRMTRNRRLARKGRGEELVGRARRKVGEAEEDFEDISRRY